MSPLTPLSRNGVTLLEMTVASLIFMIFVGGVMGIWGSLERQRMHVQARARLDSEAQLARSQLLTDISSATAVTSLTGSDVTMTYAASGSTVTYSRNAENNQLLRYESATISTTTAALYLSSISTASVNNTLHLRCLFQKKPFPSSATTLAATVDLWWKKL